MRRRLVLACLATASVAAASVSAQPTGSNIEPKTPLSRSEPSATEFSTKETRALMHGYAKCVVARRFAKASEALLRNVGNSTLMRDYPSLVDGDCLADQKRIANDMRIGSVRMSFGGDLYRYALADALFSRELASVPAPDFSGVAKLQHWRVGAQPQRVTAKGKTLSQRKYDEAMRDYNQVVALTYLSHYGECIVRKAPSQSRALLLTVPDSTEEAASFNALRTAFAECLSEGASLKFSRTTLRGAIAINYYRLARAALGAPAERTAG
ncbi:MAG TPA: hypothetical protein VIT45_09115 [Allosphingosinicella sp.]